MERIVVAGGGLAALRAVERLRERGFSGTVTVVGEERHKPYNRPPLSKQVLTGRMRPKQLRLTTTWRDLDVQWRLGTRCVALDPIDHVLHLPGREEMPYDGLVIATGVEPRTLSGTPLHSPHVWPIRTLDDSLGLARALSRARSVAIVGGGFIGCEAAAVLRDRGLEVTLIDAGDVLLRRALGTSVGSVVTDLHRHAGVHLRLGVRVVGWEERGPYVSIQLDDGGEVRADAVVVAMGTVPNVGWLQGHGLDLSDGVLCDAACFVVGAPDVVAAGDCARWPNARFAGPPRRIEHWINAVEQAQAAADNLLAGRDRARPFLPVPRFWSDQYGVRIQGVGVPSAGTDVDIVSGVFNARRRLCATFSDDDGVLMGGVGLNAPSEMIALSERIARRGPVRVAGPDLRPQRVGGERVAASALRRYGLPQAPPPRLDPTVVGAIA